MEEHIFVRLVGEGVECWRPVRATPVGQPGIFRIESANANPDDETWEFAQGALVRCEIMELSEGKIFAAVAAAENEPRPSKY